MSKYKVGDIIETKSPRFNIFEIKSIRITDEGVFYCTNEEPPTFAIHESEVIRLYTGKGKIKVIKIEEIKKIYN